MTNGDSGATAALSFGKFWVIEGIGCGSGVGKKVPQVWRCNCSAAAAWCELGGKGNRLLKQ